MIGIFIDLNCYRFTESVMNKMLGDIARSDDADCLTVYNYSPQLHKFLNIPLSAKLLPSWSGRRKVLIDVRQACDMIEYACNNHGGKIFALCGMVDAAPMLDKLAALGCLVTLVATSQITANAHAYYRLSRSNATADTQHIADIDTDNISPVAVDTTNNLSLIDTHMGEGKVKTVILDQASSIATPKVYAASNQDFDIKLAELDRLISNLYL